MTEKDTYNAQELADALGINIKTVYRKLKKNKIKHQHLNDKSHHCVRISAEEFKRLVKGNGGEMS